MTPATPPSSRNKRSARSESLLATPERRTESDESGLITPGTIHVKDRIQPPTRPTSFASPCQIMKTPEYTPHKNKHTKRRIEFDQEKLQPVSRVLFDSDFQEEVRRNGSTLLPPKRTGMGSRVLDFYEDSTGKAPIEEKDDGPCSSDFTRNKLPKQIPGTPSDKITTYELASKWHNQSGIGKSAAFDTEEEKDIYGQEPIENPFLSNVVADKSLREERKKKLLEEDPDLEDTITYVNKSGKVVSKRYLTQEEKEQLKPTRLFADELDSS